MREIARPIKDAITQIGLGYRTQPCNRTTFGERHSLSLGHMRGMDQTPFFSHFMVR